MAAISQREVGVDTPSISEGVASAIRQRPDVLAVTDVPDAAAADALLRAAEEGLQVLACVAAPKVDLVANWMTRSFAPDTQMGHSERLARVHCATVWAPSGEDGAVY